MNENMIFKTKINTSRGSFEFEGNQEFVEKHIEKIMNLEKSSPTPKKIKNAAKKSLKKTRVSSSGARKSSIDQPKMLIELIKKEQIPDLNKFYKLKNPNTHVEKFTVLTYWLKTKASCPEVSIDEMWTAYRVVGSKPPKNLTQTLRNGKSRKSYFESGNDSGKYYITSIGETYVEHDLPKNSEK